MDPLAMPLPDATAESLPPTCQVKSWVVFGPGYWKQSLYTPAMCRRVPENFRRLQGHTAPQAKLGHDQDQLLQERLKKSLGFLSVGTVTNCQPVPGYPDYFQLDVSNVPTIVGQEINAGRLNSGSVELLPGIDDPADPSKKIDGPILTGVAFLGEEQPAIRSFPPELKPRTVPRATFADGHPVPPNADPSPWFTAMAEAQRDMVKKFSELPRRVNIAGREYAAQVICFSEMTPIPQGPTAMTPEKEAALVAAGFTPDEISAIKSAMPTAMASQPAVGAAPIPTPAPAAMGDKVNDMDGDMMSACKKFADDPNATPEQKLMAAMAKKFAEQEKRIGAFEASAEANQKKDEEAKMAAFSAQVDAVYARNDNFMRIGPHAWKAKRQDGINLLTTKAFSSEADRVKAFSEWVESIEVQPVNRAFASTISTAKDGKDKGKREFSPLQKHMLRKDGLLARQSPETTRKLRELASA